MSITIHISQVKGTVIRKQAEIDGITEVEIIGESGMGDHHVTVYQYDTVRVADTNGDPVWEESDPEGFADLCASAGIDLCASAG